MKIQIWNSIGAALIPPMTGIDAEKMFYRLRQKFGKERRKVTQSQARSGAGADHVPYTSNWILYKDLMFLADHIQPRQTSSNFQPVIPKRKKAIASQMSHFSSSQLYSLQRASSQPSSSQCAASTPAIICTQPLTSEESTDVILNIDLNDESLEFLTENEKASVADSMESSSVSLSNSSTSQGIISRSMQKVVLPVITPQKLTPPADNTKKRKHQTSDEVDAAVVKSSKNISFLANTLDIALN
ncbi:uncharacterized protein LOC143896908 [Temnothorax americanus]|uniref:uncharacterized protein LOC143896908 n=1 Tax=Temnothorax americanus TaxID=1964332 RepID=UPI0040686FC6